MDVQDELRRLEKRRQVYLSTVQGRSTMRIRREEALGDLQLTEAKIAKVRETRSTPEELSSIWAEKRSSQQFGAESVERQ